MGVKLPTEQLSRFTEAKEHGAARSGDVTMLAEATPAESVLQSTSWIRFTEEQRE